MTKAKVPCAYGGECRARCVVYKVTCRLCISVYVGNTHTTPKNRTEQHFQEVDQKVHHDKNRIPLQLILLNILTKKRPHNSVAE